MDISNEINDIIQSTKGLAIELSKDNKVEILKNDLAGVVEKTVDHAAKYIIKAMPVPDAVKDVLIDVKDAIKTNDLKGIINTAVKSTIREGLEMLGLPEKSINSLSELKDIAKKGGLITAIKNGIEICESNYLRNNIVADYVYKFFDKLKNYIMNNEFIKYLNRLIDKLEEKKNKFLEMCEEWYKAYKEKDLDEVNNIAETLNENKYVLTRYNDCIKENNVIQNITAMVNNKKDILTANQQRLCQVI